MKTIIAGSRSITEYRLVELAMSEAYTRGGIAPTLVLSGKAAGVDRLGELWAERQTPPIHVAEYPADWKRHGKKAGPIRNQVMAENASALVAIWDGASAGTLDMVRRAHAEGLRVHVHVALPDHDSLPEPGVDVLAFERARRAALKQAERVIFDIANAAYRLHRKDAGATSTFGRFTCGEPRAPQAGDAGPAAAQGTGKADGTAAERLDAMLEAERKRAEVRAERRRRKAERERPRRLERARERRAERQADKAERERLARERGAE